MDIYTKVIKTNSKINQLTPKLAEYFQFSNSQV